MGLRHLVVVDNDHKVVGIVTRKDIAEHRLEHHWFQEVRYLSCLGIYLMCAPNREIICKSSSMLILWSLVW